MNKSSDYEAGFTQALVYISDIFELHSSAFVKKGLLRKIDVKLVINIIDAAIRRRETLADVGPKGVDLYIGKNRSASLKEK